MPRLSSYGPPHEFLGSNTTAAKATTEAIVGSSLSFRLNQYFLVVWVPTNLLLKFSLEPGTPPAPGYIPDGQAQPADRLDVPSYSEIDNSGLKRQG